MSWEWKSVDPPEVLVAYVYFEQKAEPAYCDAIAYRKAEIYEREGRVQLRWQLLEYRSNEMDGTTHFVVSTLACDWVVGMDDARVACEEAHALLLKERGPLHGEEPEHPLDGRIGWGWADDGANDTSPA